MTNTYSIRSAVPADLPTLQDFTLQEASEAEGRMLDQGRVRVGVAAAFAEPPLATYWVAEATDGRTVANVSVVKEWSNFHAGHYWWVQSLYIVPEHRRAGLVELLLDHVSREAAVADALEVRLYVHQGNERAVRAYRRCGFTLAPYMIMSRSVAS